MDTCTYELKNNCTSPRENIFQVCDGINVHTNSTEIEKKTFCFLVSCLIYNLWQFSSEKMKGVTLRRFTRKITNQTEVVLDNEDPPQKRNTAQDT